MEHEFGIREELYGQAEARNIPPEIQTEMQMGEEIATVQNHRKALEEREKAEAERQHKEEELLAVWSNTHSKNKSEPFSIDEIVRICFIW